MKVFFDSSALAKRYIEEPGSEIVEQICRDIKFLAVSIICLPEIISALNRLKRENLLDEKQFQTAKEALLKDLEDANHFNITPQVIRQSVELLEHSVLRAMDALHISCALEAKVDLFVSSDHKQIRAAEDAGLQTRLV